MLDLNTILILLTSFFAILTVVSGILLIIKSFLTFRRQINRSINTDVEIIRVAKVDKTKEPNKQGGEGGWREEIGAMEQLLSSISTLKERKRSLFFYEPPTIALEIANPSDSEEIFFYMAIPKKFRESVEKQIHSFYPNASIEKIPDYTIFSPGGKTAMAVLKLKKTHALPIKTYETMEVDPLNEVSNALSKLNTEEEGAVIQMILRPVKNGWQRKGREIAHEMQQGKRLKDVKSLKFAGGILGDAGRGLLQMTQGKDGSGIEKENKIVQLTPEEQELVKRIEIKTNKTAFDVNIRLLASANTEERAHEILSHLENAFGQFEYNDVNHFQVKSRLQKKEVAFHYIFRNFEEKNGMILDTEEIASIFHFPISTTETPKIKLLKSNTAPPPINIPKEGLLLGYNDYRGVHTEIRLSDADRRRHLYVIGQTGTGKSNFLQELAKQDVRNKRGMCFIDPHGDAIEDILTAVPRERAEDVIIFDPSDIERPFGLNMLEFEKPEQKTFVINEMIGIFDKLYDLKATGGPMFEQYMRNAMLLIMEDQESGSTLMEISKVLSDEDFRKMKISKSKNRITNDFWTKEAEKAGGEAALANMVPYITSKLTTFISNDMMRPIIAQQKSTINIREIMDNGKILLVNLSKGKIGEINSKLLGMVIVGKILMAALSRVDIADENKRKDFHLFIDEFQNVTTDSISQILSEARKYRLVLHLAHQFIGQLDEGISKAVFGNVGSMTVLRVGAEDADFLEKQFLPVFTANDLVNVDNFQGFAKLLLNNESTKPFNIKFYPPTEKNLEFVSSIKQLSRLRYGRDAELVNREIFERTNIK